MISFISIKNAFILLRKLICNIDNILKLNYYTLIKKIVLLEKVKNKKKLLMKYSEKFIGQISKLILYCNLILYSSIAWSSDSLSTWEDTILKSSGQTIFFHAWGGDKNINSYIKWAADEVNEKYNINVKHVKVSDTSNVVARILSEKNASKHSNGAVDLVWINGENFSRMKQSKLLLGENWIFEIPNSNYLDFKNNPSLLNDFGINTEGMEMPWGLSQLTFYYDSKFLKTPPKSSMKLKQYILNNKGRFTFPQPPDFVGTSFLKQILIELISDRDLLKSQYTPKIHEKELEPLWIWLDEVTPNLWRKGRNYPSNYLALTELVAEREIDIGMAFNISHASNAISEGRLPKTVRSYIHEKGSLANVHFLTIPYNSSKKEAAKIFVNFLISPDAQLRKQNNKFWGDPSVLSMDKLDIGWKKKFYETSKGIATLSNDELKMKFQEPHPSWVKVLEEGWIRRYGS